MNQANLSYVCRELIGVRWCPVVDPADYNVINKCQSKLEIMFLLGAFYYLEQLSIKLDEHFVGDNKMKCEKALHCGSYVKGFVYYPVFGLWCEVEHDWENIQPESILFVPQITFHKEYHHDFGIFYNYGEGYRLKYGVEVDGYNVHKERRNIDLYRDGLVEYKIIRVQEEVHSPKNWFNIVMKNDADIYWNEIHDNYEKEELNEQD